MCNFLSAIVLESGEVICDPQSIDSHEDLLCMNHVRDGYLQYKRFARVEFVPPQDYSKIFNLEEWQLSIDEYSMPEWLNKEDVTRKMGAIVNRMFVTQAQFENGSCDLVGGCWIIGGDTHIDSIKNARVWMIGGNAVVDLISASSHIDYICGKASVYHLTGQTFVKHLCENASVTDVDGAVTIYYASDNARVDTLSGRSLIKYVKGNASVRRLAGHSSIGNVDGICGEFPKIGVLSDKAYIAQDWRPKSITMPRDKSGRFVSKSK